MVLYHTFLSPPSLLTHVKLLTRGVHVFVPKIFFLLAVQLLLFACLFRSIKIYTSSVHG